MSDYHFSSEKTDYYFMDYVFFKLDKESFRKYPCKQCQLLVYLYSKDAVGQVVEYNVEISQNFVFLEKSFLKFCKVDSSSLDSCARQKDFKQHFAKKDNFLDSLRSLA